MMINSRHVACCAALLLAAVKPALADVPKVVTDILPVHSLVAKVMEGVSTPELLIGPGADPHNNAMRPSQAASLEKADVVFGIGPALTPWLTKPLETLAADADVLMLLDVEGTNLLHYRGAHTHAHDQEDGDDIDPHAWLDPANASLWLTAIAETLARHDPPRRDLYLSNAATAREELAELETEMRDTLHSVGPFGVHHDAFQYFEARLGLAPEFVIKEDDAHQPGPVRIAELRAQLRGNDVACVFVEPVVNRGLVETVLEDSTARILELDPIGASLESGPGLYPQVLRAIVESMRLCR